MTHFLALPHVMASCGVGGLGFGERLCNLEKEFEVYRSRIEKKAEKWKDILEDWILHNFSYDIQRELLRRSHGESVPPGVGERTAMSAIEYNTVNVGNPNTHPHQHNHGAPTMLAANPPTNLLCNYCPPAAKRKKPNSLGIGDSPPSIIINSDGRQIQTRVIANATALGGATVPISLTPVANARFNADEFDPVKIFGELTATTTAGVIGTTESGFGATLFAGFNPAPGSSNLLDHTTRILSFASDGNRIEETLEIKRGAAVTATKGYPGSGVPHPASQREEVQVAHTSKQKTGKGKKAKKQSANNSSDPSKTSGSSQRRKLKSMSIEEKYYVLQRLLKPDVSQATICEEMQLNKSVVSRIWCDRFKIEELYKGGSGNRIKVKYMHNGPAHPKKRGHGKKAKGQGKGSKNSNNSSNTASTGSTAITTPTVAPTVTYQQTLQNLQPPTFARPSILGIYASAESLNTARSFANNVQN